MCDTQNMIARGVKFAPLHMIFDIGQEGNHKAWLAISRNVLDSENMDIFTKAIEAAKTNDFLVNMKIEKACMVCHRRASKGINCSRND